MAMKLKIKKGATVEIIAGSEKGKRGTVIEIIESKMGVRIQGLRMQTHYSKQDGLQKKEGLIHYSNLRLLEAPAGAAKSPAKKTKSATTKKA